MVPVIVRMSVQANLKATTEGIPGRNKLVRLKKVMQSLKKTALERQGSIIDVIKKEQVSGQVEDFTPFWIFNGLFLKATPEVVKMLALRDDVDLITEDFSIPVPSFVKSSPLQVDAPYVWNIEKIRAQEVWDLGYDGSGVVVGILDTGVDVTHPDLSDRFRGGDTSWLDFHGEHTAPVDAAGWATGHGTHVTGIILGGDNSGSPIGVAPGAQWIAARMWNDAGDSVLSSEVHEIFEWFMDPDGDPVIPMMPLMWLTAPGVSTPSPGVYLSCKMVSGHGGRQGLFPFLLQATRDHFCFPDRARVITRKPFQ